VSTTALGTLFVICGALTVMPLLVRPTPINQSPSEFAVDDAIRASSPRAAAAANLFAIADAR